MSERQSATIELDSDLIDLEVRLQLVAARESFWAFRLWMHPDLLISWWQRDVAAHMQQFYEDFIAGKRPKIVLEAPPQHGKQLADETPILTTRGWTTHGDLKIGDEVFHPSGKTTKIVRISHKTPSKIRVELSNGEVIWCHENHEWTVKSRSRHGRTLTLSTGQLMNEKLREGVRGKRGFRSLFHLPSVSPLQGVKTRLPIAPYALGAWLGDGTRGTPCITQGDGDVGVIERMVELGYLVSARNGLRYSFCVPGHSLRPELKEFGFDKPRCVKYIPDIYLTASLEDRLELLAGLIDTDGSVYRPTGGVRIVTTDLELKNGIVQLLSTFGWHSSVCWADPRVSKLVEGKKGGWYIGFSPRLKVPCRIPRKRIEKTDFDDHSVAISSITRDESSSRIGHSITVDAADGLYLAGHTLQPTHNTTQVEDFMAWCVGKNPNLKEIFASFSDELGTDVNRALQRIFDDQRYKDVFFNTQISGFNVVSQTGKWMRNSSLIEFVGHKGSFRNTTVNGQINGLGLDLGFIDDPIKGRAEAQSKVTRDKAWNWLTDDFFGRFSDSAGMLMIMTRWHVDDPVGRWIEKFPETKVLRYPAIAVEDSKECPRSEADKANREIGEALFPQHKSISFLMERKKLLTEGSWQSLYQQNPIVVGGGILPVEKLKVLNQFDRSKITSTMRYWDKAGTEDDGAFTAGVRMHAMSDGTFVISHISRGQWAALEREEKIKTWTEIDAAEFGSYEVWVEQEPGSGGKESAERTIRMLAGYICYADKVTGSKEVRANPFAAQVQGGNVYLVAGAWVSDFIDECEVFPAGKYKDQVDAAAGAFSKLSAGTAYLTDYSKWV